LPTRFSYQSSEKKDQLGSVLVTLGWLAGELGPSLLIVPLDPCPLMPRADKAWWGEGLENTAL
jgi:hypothetical protein